MAGFLDLPSGQQNEILREIKEELGLSWNKIAEGMKVSRSTIFLYLKESIRMPAERIQLLNKNKNLDIEKYQQLRVIQLPQYGLKKINKPRISKKFAEFLGALSGDGCVCKTGYATTICGSALVDSQYVSERIYGLFKELFKIDPKMCKQKNEIVCRVYSKALQDFLSKKWNFPAGNRKNRTHIPKEILKNEKFLRCYLCGLFDTDGSFHRKRKNSAVVEYISCSPNFLLETKNALRGLGFSATISGKSLYIYDQKQILRFFEEIKPKNLKHITKYKIFRKTGKVPTHEETIKFLRPWSSGLLL